MELLGIVLVPVLWWLGWLSTTAFVLYLLLAFFVGTLFSLWAVLIEEFTYQRYTSWGELARLLLYALVEHAGYHQLVLWSRTREMVDYFRGRRGWGAQRRAGFRRRP